jgi:hypothetical protein
LVPFKRSRRELSTFAVNFVAPSGLHAFYGVACFTSEYGNGGRLAYVPEPLDLPRLDHSRAGFDDLRQDIPLYPAPIAEIFGPVPYQICEFHIVAEITKAVLKAVAKVRKTLTAQIPKLPRGRPTSKAAKHKARAKHALRHKVTNLFDHRYLFVQHSLTPSERKTLARISRGHPQLRALREIMDEKSTGSLTAAAGARRPCRS